jgi:hypothetical protein
LDGVGGDLVFEVVFYPEDVGADAFASVRETVAIALEAFPVQDNLVVAVGAVDFDAQGFSVAADALEAFGLLLVAMGFRDQAVQMGLQHGRYKASTFGVRWPLRKSTPYG